MQNVLDTEMISVLPYLIADDWLFISMGKCKTAVTPVG